MRRLLPVSFLTVVFFTTALIAAAQSTKKAGTDTAISKQYTQVKNNAPTDESKEAQIKAKLIELAINNPQIDAADAQIKIAEYGLNKVKGEWLSTVSASSNINEFVVDNKVVNGIAAASLYPKYNLGVTVPFDIFSRTKAEKNIANQNIVSAKALKQDRIRTLKSLVLTLYENYKEKKELYRLQKVSTEGDNDSYVSAQKSYTDGTIQLEEMNRAYQTYISAQSKLISNQRDYNVSVIDLEQIIGVPVEDAIKDATAPKPTDN